MCSPIMFTLPGARHATAGRAAHVSSNSRASSLRGLAGASRARTHARNTHSPRQSGMPAAPCGQRRRAASCRHGPQGPSTPVCLRPIRHLGLPSPRESLHVRFVGCSWRTSKNEDFDSDKQRHGSRAAARAAPLAAEHHEGRISAGGPTVHGRGFVPARFHDSERDEARGPRLCTSYTQVRPGTCDRLCVGIVFTMRGTMTRFPCSLCRALSPHPRILVLLCLLGAVLFVQARLVAATWPLSRGRGIT